MTTASRSSAGFIAPASRFASRNASAKRHHALTAQRLAESRQLAAQSGALLSSDPDLAALLAVHAYRTSATREATAALYAAAALPLRKQLITGTAPVDAAALSSNGRALATHSGDGRIQIWELPEGRVRHTMAAPGDGEIAAFSPDGRILAVATTTAIGLWDATDGRELATVRTPDGAVRGVAFSPDGRSLAAASTRAVRVWDVAGGRTRHTLTDHPDPEAVTFGPDGHTVAAADRNGLVRVWDTSTGRTRSVHDSRIKGTAVAFSADGRTYAGSPHRRRGGTAAGAKRNRPPHLEGRLGISYGEVVFAPDGGWTLAVPGAGDTVLLWDTATGTPLTTVTAGYHGRGILSVASSTRTNGPWSPAATWTPSFASTACPPSTHEPLCRPVPRRRSPTWRSALTRAR
ncbi:WD40 repeat domain-containing protein [Streptomyces shaanxiensis]